MFEGANHGITHMREKDSCILVATITNYLNQLLNHLHPGMTVFSHIRAHVVQVKC